MRNTVSHGGYHSIRVSYKVGMRQVDTVEWLMGGVVGEGRLGGLYVMSSVTKGKIKVVIWDLDDTLWKGSLAEIDKVEPFETRFEIVKELNRRGIVSSICSKNDPLLAKSMLESIGMWEEFVFPHIAFVPKGGAVRHTLEKMHLRAENALFIDDNALNRQEVLHFNPGISTLDAVDCDGILRDENLQGKEDQNCTRLQSYKLLEKKAEKEKGFATNEEFLQKSNIRIELLNFSEEMLERMYELCMRTNQLNFTMVKFN